MTNRAALIGLFATLALGNLACGGGGSGGGGGGSGGSLALDDVPTRYSEILCSKAYECCTAEQLSVTTAVGTDKASCKTSVTGMMQMAVTDWKRSQAAGRMAYHGDKFGACMDAFGASTCTELNTGSANTECEGAFEPKVAPGGACGSDTECIAGFCLGYDTFDHTDGVCTAFAASGASCSDSQCAKGSYCNFANGKSTCAPTKADGASCDYANECKSGGCNGETRKTCGSSVGPGKCFVTAGCSFGNGRPSLLSGFGVLALVGLALRRTRRARQS